MTNQVIKAYYVHSMHELKKKMDTDIEELGGVDNKDTVRINTMKCLETSSDFVDAIVVYDIL